MPQDKTLLICIRHAPGLSIERSIGCTIVLSCFAQLLHQPMHIYRIYTLKHLKTLRRVSALRQSSGSYILLAKVTLEIVTD